MRSDIPLEMSSARSVSSASGPPGNKQQMSGRGVTVTVLSQPLAVSGTVGRDSSVNIVQSNQASSIPQSCYYSYRVKILTPTRKKDSVTRELRNYNGRFTSVPEVKVRIAEEFQDSVPSRFSVGYFDPGPATRKRWLCCEEDLVALYSQYRAYPGKEILLWCEGSVSDDPPNSKRRKKSSSSREEQENHVEELAAELKERHEESLELSELQYRLWARMIVTGVHSSKDQPPQVPMITGVARKRSRKSVDVSDERKSFEDSIVSTASAVVKAIQSSSIVQSPQINQNVLHSQPVAVSPGRATDIRGKSFSQLAALKQLFEDDVLTEQEFLEQKQAILLGLKKL